MESFVRSAYLLIITLLVSCATSPDFKPSPSLEKAANSMDARRQCAQYQIDASEIDAAGQTSVVFVQPWLTCLEEANRRFPDLLDSRPVVTLVRTLNARITEAGPHGKVSQVSTLSAHVKNILLSQAETSETLNVQPVANLRLHSELGALAEDLKEVFEKPAADPRAKGKSINLENRDQVKYCSRVRTYIQAVSDLRDLLEYRDLANTQSDSKLSELKIKLSTRIDQLKQDCLTTRIALQNERSLFAKAPQYADCLFIQGVKPTRSRTRARKRS